MRQTLFQSLTISVQPVPVPKPRGLSEHAIKSEDPLFQIRVLAAQWRLSEELFWKVGTHI